MRIIYGCFIVLFSLLGFWYSPYCKGYARKIQIQKKLCNREFDSSFFGVLMQILYLSHLRLIFLSNFVIFIVLLCTLCGIIKKTDFIIGEKRYVYIYHWK